MTARDRFAWAATIALTAVVAWSLLPDGPRAFLAWCAVVLLAVSLVLLVIGGLALLALWVIDDGAEPLDLDEQDGVRLRPLTAQELVAFYAADDDERRAS